SPFTLTRAQDQIAVSIDQDTARAFDTEIDDAGDRARRDDQVVFPLLLPAVVNNINARIDRVSLDLCISPHARAPKFGTGADEVFDSPGQLTKRLHARRPVSAYQFQSQLRREPDLCWRQGERVASAASDIFRPGCVRRARRNGRLEAQRYMTV